MSQTRVQQLMGMAQALIQQEAWPQLLAVFEEVAALTPTDPKAHYNLASVLHRLKRHDEARRALLQALSLRPGYPLAMKLLPSVERAGALAPAPPRPEAPPTAPAAPPPAPGGDENVWLPVQPAKEAEERVFPIGAQEAPSAGPPATEWVLEPEAPPAAAPVEWVLEPAASPASPVTTEVEPEWTLTPTSPPPAPVAVSAGPQAEEEWVLTPASAPTGPSPSSREATRSPVPQPEAAFVPDEAAPPAVEAADQWCLVGQGVDPETLMQAYLREPERAGLVRLEGRPGGVSIVLESVPAALLRSLLHQQLRALGVLALGIMLGVCGAFAWGLAFLVSFFAILSGDVFAVFNAFYRFGMACLGVLRGIVLWFKTALEAGKVWRAASGNQPYYLAPSGAQVRNNQVVAFGRQDPVQLMQFDLTEPVLEQRLKKGGGCLAGLMQLLLLPLLLLTRKRAAERGKQVSLFAFVVGIPIDLSEPMGALNKKMRRMRELKGLKARRSRRVYLLSVDPAAAPALRATIESSLERPVVLVDDQFASERLW